MKILFCASEAYPFAKSGGLADVAYALPKALSATAEVTLILPWYRFMKLPVKPVLIWEKRVTSGGVEYPLSFWKLTFEGLEVLLVKTDLLYERDTLYGGTEGYRDNDLRFMIFSRAITAYAKENFFDILHLNDWHTALAALFAKEENLPGKVVFTIHNLSFQGIFERDRLEVLGIAPDYFQMELLEFYGKINFLKAGIAFCDALTTVSPTYAKEIQTPEFGCGLDGFLRKHSDKLSGILNGIDTSVFDPKNDPMLACTLKRKITTWKACNKKDFWGKKSPLPLFVFIGRLTEQKGIDLLTSLHEELAGMPLLFAFLGEGDETIVKALETMGEHKNISYMKGYDEALAHQMYAAADFLVMPSRFEPCGLNQMIAMRYGTVPVVHKTGGLADTVHSRGKKCGRGIVFTANEKNSLLKAIEKALLLYADKEKLEEVNHFNMRCNFSFEASAKKYIRLYRQLQKKERVYER